MNEFYEVERIKSNILALMDSTKFDNTETEKIYINHLLSKSNDTKVKTALANIHNNKYKIVEKNLNAVEDDAYIIFKPIGTFKEPEKLAVELNEMIKKLNNTDFTLEYDNPDGHTKVYDSNNKLIFSYKAE